MGILLLTSLAVGQGLAHGGYFVRGLYLSPGPAESRDDSIYLSDPAAMVLCIGDLWLPATPAAHLLKVGTRGASLTPAS